MMSVGAYMVEIVRKDIKHLHLGVYPPIGRIRVATPERTTDESIRLFVISKIGWIKRQQSLFLKQERQSELQYNSGESHYYRGKRYLLQVEEAANHLVQLGKGTIHLNAPADASIETRQRMMDNWYRKHLRHELELLISKWEPILGVKTQDWGIKVMRTRWGTCNIQASRLWFNLELAKKPPQCLEYIVVHEMAHLLERHHNERFQGILDSVMPNWKSLRNMLNKSPLAHEDWEY